MSRYQQVHDAVEILANAVLVVLTATHGLVDEKLTFADSEKAARALLDQIAKVETIFHE
jgi:hypothetical protein